MRNNIIKIFLVLIFAMSVESIASQSSQRIMEEEGSTIGREKIEQNKTIISKIAEPYAETLQSQNSQNLLEEKKEATTVRIRNNQRTFHENKRLKSENSDLQAKLEVLEKENKRLQKQQYDQDKEQQAMIESLTAYVALANPKRPIFRCSHISGQKEDIEAEKFDLRSEYDRLDAKYHNLVAQHAWEKMDNSVAMKQCQESLMTLLGDMKWCTHRMNVIAECQQCNRSQIVSGASICSRMPATVSKTCDLHTPFSVENSFSKKISLTKEFSPLKQRRGIEHWPLSITKLKCQGHRDNLDENETKSIQR